MLIEYFLCSFVDHRAHVRRQIARVADLERFHRAGNHPDHAIGHVLLHEQNPQGRAALTSALEGRGDDIARDLFRQRRGIDDHRILAARFGNEGDDRPVALRKRAVDHARSFGRAGEHDARQQRMLGQRCADDPAGAGRELDHVLGNARLMHQFDRQSSDQRRLPGRFCDDGIARSQRRRHQAGEDGEGEIPRRDARDHPAAV